MCTSSLPFPPLSPFPITVNVTHQSYEGIRSIAQSLGYPCQCWDHVSPFTLVPEWKQHTGSYGKEGRSCHVMSCHVVPPFSFSSLYLNGLTAFFPLLPSRSVPCHVMAWVSYLLGCHYDLYTPPPTWVGKGIGTQSQDRPTNEPSIQSRQLPMTQHDVMYVMPFLGLYLSYPPLTTRSIMTDIFSP